MVLFCGLAPFVHFYVQLYWSMVTLRALPTTRSQLFATVWLFAGDLIGAALAALVLAAPLAWLTRGRPVLLAIILASTTAAAAFFLWQGSFTDRAALLAVIELLAFFFLCWGAASVVIRRPRGGAPAT